MQPQYVSDAPSLSPMSQGGLITRSRNPFWLAPMAGITDVCFRQLMDEMQAGVLISELVSAKGLFFNSIKTRKMMRIHKSPGTIVGIQLFGESPEDIVRAVSVVEETGADFIDINMGCPVKKVVKKGCGAALMRDPVYLEKFLTTIKKGIRLPLTVKMRTGWNENELTIHECVQAAYQSGCEWVAIHGRTRAQGYEGKADWDLIAEVKSRAKLPIIGNGDIRNANQAKQRLQETGVDAVMIGRGALRNPWIFKECVGLSVQRSGLKLLNQYLSGLQENYDARSTLILLRKFSSWLAFGYPGASKFRKNMFECFTTSEVMQRAEDFFNQIAYLPTPSFEDSEAFMMGGHG
ncbi:MAG: tRNA dihydrouridine synthase DusB [Nitrospina sp.]|nr:tRNA dihydrouridine synthase DusB [Nitrospina sp.]MBT3508384.1 tRNA dihydrouridine synthase DusB [Nitrospina sp.]MBT3874674.1 tRNA dihydrouridine synthase DusB [Nitrospina sp.]MBT4049408.1 tRNA dihydrouridine synthase DusB [Nitrospina sp.]MBT5347854.1 tRNA dihydrouridine synthase DusB [Nitrospina sp.]